MIAIWLLSDYVSTKIVDISGSTRKRQPAERTPCLPTVFHHGHDWAGCTMGMIGLPDAISTRRRAKVDWIAELIYRSPAARDGLLTRRAGSFAGSMNTCVQMRLECNN
jgi:hypothetical protein